MPAAMARDEGSKRKRPSTGEQPKKRRRPEEDEAAAEDDGQAEILKLEQGILQSKKNYNDITLLLATARGADSQAVLATVALCRLFLRLLGQGALVLKRTLSEKEAVVVSWLRERLSDYKTVLLALLADEQQAVTALSLCMRLLKAEGEHLSDKKAEYPFPAGFLEDIIGAVLASASEDVGRAFAAEYAEKYDDVRYYSFRSIKSIVNDVGKQHQGSMPPVLFDRLFSLLSSLDGVPRSADELEDFYVGSLPPNKSHPLRSVTQHKRQGQAAWLAVLGAADSKERRKRVLAVMSTVVAPWFAKPELLADFLTSCYHAGGSTSLLALSGVFYLIQERNLDYPSFYPKLYSLLDRQVLHSRHRSRFFRLLDTFLASTHLPAALVASFIKRLSRLSINGPPSAIAFVVPWIYNLLRRHPSCSFMIHREVHEAEAKRRIQEGGFEDPFLPDEADPLATRAMESCLWELVQLQSHYHPNIGTVAKIISEQFTKQMYNMEDFLDHSYASLLEAELAKEIKKSPVVEFQIPKRIFFPDEATPTGTEAGSLVARLWDFGETP